MNVAEYKRIIAKQPQKRKKLESHFQTAAEHYLQYKGYTVMRINSSAMIAESGSYLKSYKLCGRGKKESQGFPDLIAFKNNKFLVIEIKSPNGRLNQNQKDFKAWWELSGHKYNVANNLDELIRIVGEFENDNG
jgi:hypothetical protein